MFVDNTGPIGLGFLKQLTNSVSICKHEIYTLLESSLYINRFSASGILGMDLGESCLIVETIISSPLSLGLVMWYFLLALDLFRI